MSENTIKEINDFYTYETMHLFNEIIEKFKDDSCSPQEVFMEMIDFLYNDLSSLSYAKMLSDEVRGHFTKLAYQEYEKSDILDYLTIPL